MTLRVEFHGGPADGTTRTYPQLTSALASLHWSSEEPDSVSAIYQLSDEQPDAFTGCWHYHLEPRLAYEQYRTL